MISIRLSLKLFAFAKNRGLIMECPNCQLKVPNDSKFCKECGCSLVETIATAKTSLATEGERKHVTILFSDLSGYTTITERLDPEEVKGIMSLIFSKITGIIQRYDGFIERFLGDAVMAVFGIPKVHEDDPLRAIRAAIEIHAVVGDISPQFQEKIGHPLTMHTGINTGLVVTGEIDVEKGTQGLIGDAINVASRLEGIAKAGEIVVGSHTYKQALYHFEFETLEPTRVKGKTKPVKVYKLMAAKGKPDTSHRTQGVRAELIGRQYEMSLLLETVQRLREGQGSIVTIVGDAGTGKSRLVHEFKARLNLKNIGWHKGHAYGYTQNTPYFPIVDLFTKAFRIEDGDTPDQIRVKIESALKTILGPDNTAAPFIGGLFSLDYPETADVSPEFWKTRLFDAVLEVLNSIVQNRSTVLYFEDLHWADPSSVELMHKLMDAFAPSALFICASRPVFDPLDGRQSSEAEPGPVIQKIRLHDLPGEKAQAMLRSLLQTESVPAELIDFVRKKAEGNPFYLEEVVNALIESEILVRDNGTWKLARAISEVDIPSSIQGVIAARIDRLDENAKRVLQEASVIGRAFLYDILRRITDPDVPTDQYLSSLERLDLIRTLTQEPDLEYIFKHALTQDVVYNGLLKRERRIIHERIGIVIEQLFQGRLAEFYEALSFHFKNGLSGSKAIRYLMKSGEKCMLRYAVQESHQYYREAYKLLTEKQKKSEEERDLLFELLSKWSLVYYYRGDFKKQTYLLKSHEKEATVVVDKEKRGMFYAWLGFNLLFRWELKDSYTYLRNALSLGEETGNKLIECYACSWLTYTCAESAEYDEAVVYWERAQQIIPLFESNNYLFFKSMGGIGHTNFYRGEKEKSFKIGKILLDYGEKRSNIRSVVVGHLCRGEGFFASGDFTSAIECFKKAIEVSADPFYSQWPRVFLGVSYVQNGQMIEAESALNKVIAYAKDFGCEIFNTVAFSSMGVVLINNGEMARGLKMLKDIHHACLEKEYRWGISLMEYILGNVYLQILDGVGPVSLSIVIKNFGFFIKNVPFAAVKGKTHFERAIAGAEQIGAKGTLGAACLDLGRLFKAKNKIKLARESVSRAVQVFEETGATVFLEHARKTLASLG